MTAVWLSYFFRKGLRNVMVGISAQKPPVTWSSISCMGEMISKWPMWVHLQQGPSPVIFHLINDTCRNEGDPGRWVGSKVGSGEGRWSATALGTAAQCGTAGTEAEKEALRIKFRRRLIKLFTGGGWLVSVEGTWAMGKTDQDGKKGQMKCWVGDKGKMKLPKKQLQGGKVWEEYWTWQIFEALNGNCELGSPEILPVLWHWWEQMGRVSKHID